MPGVLTFVVIVAVATSRLHAANDIVLYSSDFNTIRGNWANVASSGAAGGQALSSAQRGWSTLNAALPAPADYVEAAFNAPSGTPYHVWVRLRAANNSKYNDSVWVQFSDALDANAATLFPIGSTSGLLLDLENCNNCALSGWGWQDKAYWLPQTNVIQFASSGAHTIRIQTREDGVQIDQVVLSPAAFLTRAPGAFVNDSTIVSGSPAVAPSTPFTGTPAAIPGQINAVAFDNGGEGVAYHDTTSGNMGGLARATDVDIETSSDGGYDVGWIAAGEWLNYTVAVPRSGSYSVQIRVASPSGASMHVGFNGPSSVWSLVSVPVTAGWQSWTTVTLPVTLAAGTQVMTLLFDTGGMNFRSVTTTSAGSPIVTPPAGPLPYSGSPVLLPGTVEAENFDNGGEGVAYHDTTPGNSGGVYRNTDVDLEQSTDGGYDVGWTAAGEWLKYTVKVGSAGRYTVGLRVASDAGGTMHVGFNGASAVWSSVTIPSTGNWQRWTTVNVPVTLAAGVQQMTLQFDTAGVNLNSAAVAAVSMTSPPIPSPPAHGTELIVVEWNVQVDDASSAHARTVIDSLAALNPQPQVIVMAEGHKSQYDTYLSELLDRTGLTWQGVFQTHCPPGAWNGSTCSGSEDEGVGVFTSLPVVGSSVTLLPYADAYHSARAAARLAVSLNGLTVQIFGTHLQVNNAAARHGSMVYLKNWTSNYSRSQLVAGDFNADQDQIDTTTGMLPNFIDSWTLVGSGRGFTNPTPSPVYKLDYWFADAGGKATPNWSSVVTGTGTISDHFPLQASFTIVP